MARRWHNHFLSVLRNTGNVRAACQEVGIERSTAYRARSKNQHFKERWDEALEEAADALEAEARRRAIHGIDVPVHYRGQQVATVRRYSDGLLKLLLAGARPERYGPTAGKQPDEQVKPAVVELVERLRQHHNAWKEEEGTDGHTKE